MTDTWSQILTGLSTVATVIAVVVAVATYRRSEKDKRKAQARLVYSVLSDDLRFHKKGEWTTDLPSHAHIDPVLISDTKQAGVAVRKAKKDFWSCTVEVHNGSSEMISNVNGELTYLGAPDSRLDHATFHDLVLRPNETSLHTVYMLGLPPGDDTAQFPPIIYFRDAASRHWRRSRGAPVEELRWIPKQESNRLGALRRDIIDNLRVRWFGWKQNHR